jgi:hypothetical protein
MRFYYSLIAAILCFIGWHNELCNMMLGNVVLLYVLNCKLCSVMCIKISKNCILLFDFSSIVNIT